MTNDPTAKLETKRIDLLNRKSPREQYLEFKLYWAINDDSPSFADVLVRRVWSRHEPDDESDFLSRKIKQNCGKLAITLIEAGADIDYFG